MIIFSISRQTKQMARRLAEFDLSGHFICLIILVGCLRFPWHGGT